MDQRSYQYADDFQEIIPAQNVRILQVIHVALGMSVVIFMAVVFLFYGLISEEIATEEPGYLNIMTVIHLVLLVVMLPVSQYLYDRLFLVQRSHQATGRPQSGSGATDAHLTLLRTAWIIRLALREGVAFFGLIICLVAVTQGIMQAYPVYWVNLLSAILFEILIIKDFPTRQKMALSYREKIRNGSIG